MSSIQLHYISAIQWKVFWFFTSYFLGYDDFIQQQLPHFLLRKLKVSFFLKYCNINILCYSDDAILGIPFLIAGTTITISSLLLLTLVKSKHKYFYLRFLNILVPLNKELKQIYQPLCNLSAPKTPNIFQLSSPQYERRKSIKYISLDLINNSSPSPTKIHTPTTLPPNPNYFSAKDQPFRYSPHTSSSIPEISEN